MLLSMPVYAAVMAVCSVLPPLKAYIVPVTLSDGHVCDHSTSSVHSLYSMQYHLVCGSAQHVKRRCRVENLLRLCMCLYDGLYQYVYHDSNCTQPYT